jgi:prepilin-type N-terminal cleavage/methylation domain-containing protein
MTPERFGQSPPGFALLEVMIAMSLFVIGAVIGLTVITNTSARGELSREHLLAYKACQDVMEALMSMDKATLLAQAALQKNSGQAATFEAIALKETDGSSPRGLYLVTDVTSRYEAAAPANSVVELVVRFSWKKVNIQLTNRRFLP